MSFMVILFIGFFFLEQKNKIVDIKILSFSYNRKYEIFVVVVWTFFVFNVFSDCLGTYMTMIFSIGQINWLYNWLYVMVG